MALECGILIAGVIGFLATDGCQFIDARFAAPEQGWRVRQLKTIIYGPRIAYFSAVIDTA